MGVTIHPVHQRIAELWMIGKKRVLTDTELKDLEHAMQVNVKLCWEMAYLENASLMASMTADIDWQHEICREIEEFPKKIKRPDRKGTDQI